MCDVRWLMAVYVIRPIIILLYMYDCEFIHSFEFHNENYLYMVPVPVAIPPGKSLFPSKTRIIIIFCFFVFLFFSSAEIAEWGAIIADAIQHDNPYDH
jgi:hypothetical protein